ncbi:hypothetical protein ESY86_19240 [Subsaximicrobium wynnwilliamsii]|jgi:hypothetical protein|uniref:Uncharacterized protein n=1 Tax=Subsaximicrobium wynnwilliamsii TaxID=291179 RepID=A0A5C6ZDD9_9FLAO|nr:hypothetical protein [Subsaximicrobium wynnwilliamsii]TXD81888.1 hypothetical protein ESY87_16185 [Subsaximicrobium wynnwilliamsii]TXD86790.1 hypothetical protein ESY86_19240 [Subsaximicrobium wynnwilliamsii]TXE01339.1 hypothetical protein ESY88_16175 [Subsaximicrobium wynnwilliamsii]
MMVPAHFNELIEQAEELALYHKLIVQINKDFLLANIDLDFELDILPSSLKFMLHETVYKLIASKFADYLNLLYIIDVSEEKIRSLDGSDPVKLSEQVSFLILQREWQKVWLRNKHSS